MKQVFWLFLALIPIYNLKAAVSPLPGDVRSFVESIQGTYQIDWAGGHQPAPDNNQAEVFADATAGVLVMPYCGANGLCDPGYLDLIYGKTEIERHQVTADHYRVEIRTWIGAKEYRYTWADEGGRITFTNYAYLVGGQLTSLQHSLHRVVP